MQKLHHVDNQSVDQIEEFSAAVGLGYHSRKYGLFDVLCEARRKHMRDLKHSMFGSRNGATLLSLSETMSEDSGVVPWYGRLLARHPQAKHSCVHMLGGNMEVCFPIHMAYQRCYSPGLSQVESSRVSVNTFQIWSVVCSWLLSTISRAAPVPSGQTPSR